MNGSFYTAALGASMQQSKLDIVSNNIANINNNGYKSKSGVFQELIQENMHEAEGVETRLYRGVGNKLSHTNTDFGQAGFTNDGSPLSFAIEGSGFFMIQDSKTDAITYTRTGNFRLSELNNTMYLVTQDGKRVLDETKQPITMTGDTLSSQPGMFAFANTNGMLSVGSNEFQPVTQNGDVFLATDGRLIQGSLEMSNVDLPTEMSEMIEASRAYAYMLKMVQTSDEVEETINRLKG